MNRLDRYLFLQLLGPFGFFTLALTGILWLAQTLPLVSIIIDNGRSGLVFLEFSTLLLPNVLAMILPISAFIATIYTLNRLYSESEMVVVMSAGLSPWQIAKSTAAFGLAVTIALYIIVITLLPGANTRLGDQIDLIKQDALGSLLREKQFIHPASGVTIYISEASKAGEIQGLFLHDQRDKAFPTTYSARQALLLQDTKDGEVELRLIMSNGIIQRYSEVDNTVNTVEFEQFVYDLSGFAGQNRGRNRLPIEYTLTELFDAQGLIDNGARRSFGTYIAEAHNKLAQPMLALALPLFALALMLTAKYRRSGYTGRIIVISVLGITALILSLAAKSMVSTNPEIYYVAYIPVAFVLVISVLILLRASAGRDKSPKHITGEA